MKIAISGAQCTGKTTILNKLYELYPNWVYFKNVVRDIANKGIPINDLGTNDTQKAIMDAHIDNLSHAKIDKTYVYDRCLLDWFAFTNDLFKNNKISQEQFEYFEYNFKKNINSYDIIFYLEPEFEIVDDGFRSTNKEYQNQIVNEFRNVIEKYRVQVIKVSGSVKERINLIIKTIKDFNNGTDKSELFLGYRKSEIKPEFDFNEEEAIYKLGYNYIKYKLYQYSSKVILDNNSRKIILCENYLKSDEKGRHDIILETGKEIYNKMTLNENNIIPKEFWTDTVKFSKHNLDNFFHPYFYILLDELFKQYKPESENLLVMSCASTKPYSKNSMYKQFLRHASYGCYDLTILSVYPIFLYPLDASVQYPFNFYDWPHNADISKSFSELRASICGMYLARFINKFKYKKVFYLTNLDDTTKMKIDFCVENSPNAIHYAPLFNSDYIEELKKEYKPRAIYTKYYNIKRNRFEIAKFFNLPKEAYKIMHVEEYLNRNGLNDKNKSNNVFDF